MKEVLPQPTSAIVQNETKRVRELFDKYVVPSYARFDLVLDHGKGSYVWDVDGKRYLDLGGGIAVCSLGHAHPEITQALADQSQRLIHVSNLYYNELQGRLAKRIVDHIAPGRVFFSNSGAEANEGLFKLARKFGNQGAAASERPEQTGDRPALGRYEVITTANSFHGRTLAGIAATGQEKVKKGFEPAVEGFKQVPFNDLKAIRSAISSRTAAILIEPVQGESGVTVASPEYLIGLRQLCDERDLLLLFDEVQAGHFRTGKFQSWQRILETENADVLPDAVSMA
ncbi:MAG TPA: aminotransferase class III-fold pyridoxal phosphate-dependent enzyme, partial [Chthoniobacterales bacterium]|nr:aminotransferase class III-fold pyridoxal phosphate-dependent enzyme [Chthoniobacterales bacterium]